MSQVNYPAGVVPAKQKVAKRKPKLSIAPGNRGMAFEDEINQSNEYYVEKGLCLITKRPTPIKTVKVDYTHGPRITEAFFQTQSTTDYNGVYKGRYIDFEAKSTRSLTSFPLSNIPIQQIEHLERVLSQSGIAFFLINWARKNETYLVPARYIIDFYRSHPRSSIPYEDMRENGYLVKQGYRPRYDYLPIIIEHLL